MIEFLVVSSIWVGLAWVVYRVKAAREERALAVKLWEIKEERRLRDEKGGLWIAKNRRKEKGIVYTTFYRLCDGKQIVHGRLA